MMQLFLSIVFFFTATTNAKTWSWNCYDLQPFDWKLDGTSGHTAIYAFREGNVIDSYSDSIRLGGRSLSQILTEPTMDEPQPILISQNHNLYLDCSHDFVIFYNDGNEGDLHNLGNGPLNFTISKPVTIMSHDMISVIRPLSLRPGFDIRSGFSKSKIMFDTSSQDMIGLNITRVFVYGPLFTIEPKFTQKFRIESLSETQPIVPGEDSIIVALTDQYPEVMAQEGKVINFAAASPGFNRLTMLNWDLIGSVTLRCENSGLTTTLTESGSNKRFVAYGSLYTVEYGTELTPQQMASGHNRESFQLLVQSPK